jgi:uncharacterized repeat protein (TIGR01451 family)
MKKYYATKIILTSLVIILCFTKESKSQYVLIPDTNFKNLLQLNYPSCMSGNMLDTTCSEVVSAYYLSTGGWFISDLTGIQYFDSLKQLECAGNNLMTFPPLPPTLETLICDGNNLISIPSLPSTLKELYCGNNIHLTSLPSLPSSMEVLSCYFDSLTSLPALPSGLRYLDCGNNYIAFLPSLPSSLTSLLCWANQLNSLPSLPPNLDTLSFEINFFTTLPTIPSTVHFLSFGNNQITTVSNLPPNLIELYCNDNLLTSLPSLPSTLQKLYCGVNSFSVLPTLPLGLQILSCYGLSLTSLPSLSSTLQFIYCQNNNINSLPSLPSSLYTLNCSYNSLINLPALPSSLSFLDCSHNQLTSLPSLPTGFDNLYANDNSLTSLPNLPDTLGYLDIDNNNISCLPEIHRIGTFQWYNTGITCLPNIINISSAIPSVSSLPLCQPSSGCPSFWNISGKIFFDNNGNCNQDIADTALRNIPVRLDSGNVQLQRMLTDASGRYSFRTGLGTYNIKVDTSNAHYQVVCPGSFFYTSNLIVADSTDSLLNFALQCRPGYDLAAISFSPNQVFRPGLIRTLHTNAGDNMLVNNVSCAVGISGSVEAILNGPVNYYSYLGLPPTSINGDTITWSIADFSTVNPTTDFNIKVYADTTANIGDTICITLNVYPTSDNIPSNNSLTHCYPVVNSFDPNEKYMEPAGAVDTSTQWFTFTIFFQNTGNAPAEQIYLLDTLDTDLDATTFTYLSSSHNVITQLLPGNILRFNYPDINLPDSTNDEPNSHGYVQYKVKRKAGLPVNTVITNTAYIYFDFNPAVVTNTVSATLSINVGMNEAVVSQFEIYPNPNRGEFKIQNAKSKIEQVDIFNLVGENVYSQKPNSQLSTVNCQLKSGVYFVRVTTKNGVAVKRFVKQ